ncbi:uncharacterized protein I206_103061 [Kwoniella pini CBS 10737]|uniref:Uncharacterized protein n=1 Tax=Kwoniella pini CBS 10737 TaxID=1296096 RepID=A0A1B9IAI4_9TREE|nr:uncharacterized protein I206_01935 [Kwoniella pini CBS 10737]OCF52642.1 hypothetical protein I206_01935 [Kwoniella pini CBS 10737]
MAAVAQAPPMLPSTSSTGSISRPSSSSATAKPSESKTLNQPSKPEASDKTGAKVIVSEATPVDEKSEVKKENGDASPTNVIFHSCHSP